MPGTMTRHHLTDRLADMVAVDLVAAAAAVVDGTLATSTNLQHRQRQKQEDSDQGSGPAWD